MVGDQVLGAADDPGEIADAQLVGVAESRGDGESCRVGDAACAIRRLTESRCALLCPQPNRFGYG